MLSRALPEEAGDRSCIVMIDQPKCPTVVLNFCNQALDVLVILKIDWETLIKVFNRVLKSLCF